MRGRARILAWVACLALVGAGLYLAFYSRPPATFERVDGRIHDITVVPVDTPHGSDRSHQVNLVNQACDHYDYLQSWADRVGLPVITDLNSNEEITFYTDPRPCQGLNLGGSTDIRAIVYRGKLYATPEYLHPAGNRLATLPSAVLLLLLGAAGMGLLVWRRRADRTTLTGVESARSE